MNEEKKNILLQQISKLEEVLSALENNFDLEEELTDEYSFLSIVKDNLKEITRYTNNNQVE